VTATSPPGHIHLQWNPPSSDGGAAVTFYRVYRGTTPGGQVDSPVGTVSTTSFDDLYNLTGGNTYYYKVTAGNSAGESLPSTEVSATAVAGVPGPPQLSAATAPGPTVRLTWTVPPDGGSPITKYIVLRNGVRLVTLPASASGPTTYEDPTVAAGATYVYQVRAANLNGNGQLSNKATIIP
jgi:fibronectin type 3 domain-containing protein